MKTSSRLIGLDVLRASAIIMVLWAHSFYIFKNALSSFTIRVSHLLGDLGVLLFFVLSGFLVGRIFLKEIAFSDAYYKNDLGVFWAKRWLRTMPNYFLFLFVYIGLFQLSSNKLISAENPTFIPDTSVDFIEYFTFTQNILKSCPYFFGQTWSLAVEEWFYFLLPFPFLIAAILFGSAKNKVFKILMSIFTLMEVSSIIVIVFIPSFYERTKVVFNFQFILIGVILAYFHIKYDKEFTKYKNIGLLIGAIILLVPNFLLTYFGIEGVFGAFVGAINRLTTCIGFALIFPSFLGMNFKGNVAKFIEIISLSSYTLYLSHILVLIFIVNDKIIAFFPDENSSTRLLLFPIYFMICLVLSYLHYILFEVPVMKLRRFLPDPKVVEEKTLVNQ